MLIRKGCKGVIVMLNESRFKINVPFNEVIRLVEQLWSWELGEHVILNSDEVYFSNTVPFERVPIYLLGRRGGLSPKDAETLASYLRLHEVVALAEAFLYRFWLCKVGGGNCRGLTNIFFRIVANYRRGLP